MFQGMATTTSRDGRAAQTSLPAQGNGPGGMGIAGEVLLALVMGAAMSGLAVTWWLWTAR